MPAGIAVKRRREFHFGSGMLNRVSICDLRFNYVRKTRNRCTEFLGDEGGKEDDCTATGAPSSRTMLIAHVHKYKHVQLSGLPTLTVRPFFTLATMVGLWNLFECSPLFIIFSTTTDAYGKTTRVG